MRVPRQDHPPKQSEWCKMVNTLSEVEGIIYWSWRRRSQFTMKQKRWCHQESRKGGCTHDYHCSMVHTPRLIRLSSPIWYCHYNCLTLFHHRHRLFLLLLNFSFELKVLIHFRRRELLWFFPLHFHFNFGCNCYCIASSILVDCLLL